MREQVLERLRPGAELSGEVLATELGVSRAAVAKHVAALRAAGYEIEAVVGSGYRLLAVPDAPLPAEVRPLLSSPLWARLEGGGVTGSTNDDARALARAGAAEGTVVLASHQLSGRGRFGRTWESPEGGAYVSAVLRPPLAPSELGPLALIAALGIVRGLDAIGVSCGVKWPNDVLLDGRKLAGVLLEMTAESDRVDWVVAGFGVNVRRGSSSRPEAAYVSDVEPAIGIATVTAAVLDGVGGAYAEWLDRGFEPMTNEYVGRLTLLGEHVVVRTMDGVVRAEGVVSSVDHDGRLVLEGAAGVVAVNSGEVTLRG